MSVYRTVYIDPTALVLLIVYQDTNRPTRLLTKFDIQFYYLLLANITIDVKHYKVDKCQATHREQAYLTVLI